MKIESFSSTVDKDLFIERFTTLPKKLSHNQTRTLSPSSYEKSFLALFPKLLKELFIVSIDGIDSGRILINKTEAREDSSFFGMLEYDISNKEILKTLLDHSEKWSKENKLSNLYGPIDINIWFSNRFKVEGFEKNYFWEPHTPIEYYQHTKDLGYSDYKKFLSTIAPMNLKTHLIGHASILMAKKQGWRLERIDFKDDALLESFYELNKSGFSRNDLYEDITLEQYQKTLYSFSKQVDSKYSYLLFDPDGKLQGYCFSILDNDVLVLKTLVLSLSARKMYFAPALIFKSFFDGYSDGIRRFCGACIREGNTSGRFIKFFSLKNQTTNFYKLLNKKLE